MSRRVKPKRIDGQELPKKVDDDELVRLESELKNIQPDLFTGIPPNKKQQIIRAASVISIKNHSGPLPDPESLIEYDKVITNGADRIMAMAEAEQSFRHKQHSNIANRTLNQSSTGQKLGFILALLLILGGLFLIYTGKSLEGMASVLVPAAAIATAFLKNQFIRKTGKN